MSNRQEGDPELPGERADPENVPEDSDGEPVDPGSSGDAEADLPAPRPGLSPEKVLRRVLAALSDNDDPVEDAGIRTAFNFSSPTYRRRTGGSLAEFRAHLTDPIHRALVGHREAARGRLRTDDSGTHAEEKVVVTDADGEKSTYEFTLEKQTEGKYEDCWMVEGIELVYVGEAPDHQHMPTVEFEGVEVKCKEGEILRDVLLRASGVSPHNSAAKYANCNGMGLCGTCAVEVSDGEVTDRTAQEKRRLRMPPHDEYDNPDYRLSCQTRVLGDLQVYKHEGLWGQHVEEYARDTEEEVGGEPIRVTDEEYLGGEEAADEAAADEADAEATKEELDLSEEAQNLLAETEEMLDQTDEESDGESDPDGTGIDEN